MKDFFEESNKIMAKLDKIEKRMKVWKQALEYCAQHAHPSIVQDVARKALEYRSN